MSKSDQAVLKKGESSSGVADVSKERAVSARIQVTLNPLDTERLAVMMKTSKLKTYSEVIRDALRLYHCVLRNGVPESRVFVKKPDGSMVELVF